MSRFNSVSVKVSKVDVRFLRQHHRFGNTNDLCGLRGYTGHGHLILASIGRDCCGTWH